LNLTPDPVYLNNINAGTATASYSYAGDDNHEPSSDSKDFTIGQRVIIITADAKSKTYGDADPALTYAISSGTLAFSDAFTGSLSRATGESVGTYAINQGTVALNSNYTLTYVGADLTIGLRSVEITADAKSKTYGEADPALTYAISSGTLAFSDAFTGSLSRAAGENIGDYAINQGTVALNGNYTLTYVGANLTITPLAVTVTADAKTKVYGEVDPSLTFVSNPAVGFVLPNGDAISFSGSLSRAVGENIGNYAINQNTVANSNYTITYNTANLTITPLAVTVTADAKTKVYGDADPSLTFVSNPAVGSSLANGHTISFTGALSRAAGETVAGSPYAINQNTVANSNYTIAFTGANLTISPKPITVTPTSGQYKTYGTADPALLSYSASPAIGSSLPNGIVVNLTGALNRVAGETVGNYAIQQGGITNSANMNYNISFTTGVNFEIRQASTTTVLSLSAASVRYMDMITLTAVITPLNTATPITGSVEFKIGSVVYGTANVVPIPGATDGSVQAMLIKQLNASEMPAEYTVYAAFNSTNPNYANSTDNKKLIVIARSASYLGTSYYTGDVFVWNPTLTSSTGTVALVATIKDGNSPSGDVRGARVTFYYVNGSIYTPIPSATNLPVGLVNVSDGIVGTASAIVQLNIGNQNSASYTIAVGISGAYINKKTEPQSIAVITVTKPVPGGYVVAGGSLLNSASSGIIKGAKDIETSFSMDVQFNKKMTNPQGKSYVTFFSYNKPDGTLDNVLHQYEVASNAIAVFAVGQPSKGDATFSSKSNLVEVLEDGTRIGIESGITLQLSMTDYGAGTLDTFAITLYSKSGGVWFSSNWDVTKTKAQVLHEGNVYVSTSGLAQSTARTSDPTEEATQAAATTTVEAEAEVAEWALFTVKAYPNPSTEYFKLQLSGVSPSEQVEVNVFDVTGRFIQSKKGTATDSFQFGEQLKSGVYFIEVNAANNSQRLKVIKQ